MEDIRNKITLIGTLIERHDALMKDAADSRWVLEMVRLQDQVEGEAKMNAQRKARIDLDYTLDQVARSERLALKITGFGDFENLRIHFLELVTSYNEYTNALEIEAKEKAYKGSSDDITERVKLAHARVMDLHSMCALAAPSNIELI